MVKNHLSMRKSILCLICMIVIIQGFAQENQADTVKINTKETTDFSVISSDSTNMSPIVEPVESVEDSEPMEIKGEVLAKTSDRYKIYATPNMYNFLKLDTRLGYVYRIQWNFEDNKRYESYVNLDRLVSWDDDWVNGRFEIYHTTNIYSFLILDKINGRVWQGYWGEGAWIKRIH